MSVCDTNVFSVYGIIRQSVSSRILFCKLIILTWNSKAFSQAIDRVSTISSEKTRAVKITINGKGMTLSAQSPDAGSATEEIEINNDNVALEIGFNSRYLLDITQQIDSDGCRMVLADGTGPTIIQDASDESALYVLMPLRV